MQVKDLKRTYKLSKTDELNALKGLTFDLPESGMVFILGKSGSGKSTLLNILGGLDKATSGEIIYKGKDINCYTQSQLNKYRNVECGFIFQEYNVIPELNVFENVAIAAQLQGEKEVTARVEEVLKKVDLDGYGNRKISQLSGGQKQRVAIARALIKQSGIILADEPTGALDSVTGESIFGLLKEISKEKLVIVVSHDRDFAERFADRIIELADGKIVSDTDGGYKNIEKDDNADSRTTKSIPLKTAYNIGIKNFKYHPLRMFFCIFFSSICFTLLGVAISASFINVEKTYYNSLIDNNIRQVNVTKHRYKGIGESTLMGIFGAEYRSSTPVLIDGDDYGLLCEKLGAEEFVALSNNDNVSRFQEQLLLLKDREKFLEIWDAHPDLIKSINLNGYVHLPENGLNKLGFELTGKLPANKLEVAVPESVYNAFALLGYSCEGREYEINSPDDLIGKKIQVDERGVEYYTVTGVVYSDCTVKDCQSEKHNYHEKFYVHEDFGNFKYVEYELPQDKNKLKEIVNFEFNYEDEESGFFRLESKLAFNDYDGVDVYLKQKAGFYLSAVFGVLSVLLLANFLTASINSQRKQMGVLKSMGAGKTSLIKIYATNMGITVGIIFACSYILTLIGNWLFNLYMSNPTAGIVMNFMPFNGWLPLILFVIIGAVTAASCFVPLIKAVNKYPAEHLR